MSTHTLSDYIALAPADQPLILTPARLLRASDCQNISISVPVKPAHHVALSFQDIATLVKALSACDGRVASILLLSPSVDAATAEVLLERIEDVVLFADHELFAQIQAAKPFTELLESLPALISDDDAETRWLLATSGTTSVPKLVSHSFRSLTRTTRVAEKRSEFTWGQLYDSYRFAGLQVVLQAILGRSPLAVPSLDMKLCKRLSFFGDQGVNALSATPTLWRKILMVPGKDAIFMRSITLGGEICDQGALNALAKQYPVAKIRHIYASTEAGTGFSVTDGKEGFPLSYIDGGLDGTLLKIIDGILHIENRHVKGGYVGDERAFKGDNHMIDTGDRVDVVGDRVVFRGRASGMINVGGDKVQPEIVELIINAVDGVELSRVFGMRNPVMGQLVVAEIMVIEGVEVADVKKSILGACKENLRPYQRPAAIKVVASIKISENGKIVRS